MSSSAPRPSTHRLWLAVWAAAVATGMGAFHWSMTRPGDAFAAPVSIERSRASTVYLFAHPHCGCTTKTISALARRTDRFAADVAVVITGPAADSPSWRESPNARAAAEQPGLRIVHDPVGELAEEFGARTSGHAVIYDAEGRLRFTGGLTAARGMTGPSTGFDSMTDILNHRTPHAASAPVFGCAIFDTPAQDSSR